MRGRAAVIFFRAGLDENSLLLQVVLTRTTSRTAGEGAFVVAFAGMNANVSGEMTRSGESL